MKKLNLGVTAIRQYLLQAFVFWSSSLGVTEASLRFFQEAFSFCYSGLHEVWKWLNCIFFFWILVLIYQLGNVEEIDPK